MPGDTPFEALMAPIWQGMGYLLTNEMDLESKMDELGRSLQPDDVDLAVRLAQSEVLKRLFNAHKITKTSRK